MRKEFKFRAWHIERKEMYRFDALWGNFNTGNGYIGMLHFNEELKHGQIFSHNGNRFLIDPDNCEIMQCTGLKDKNGKEVYEGDIVNVPIGIGEFELREIVWSSGAFCAYEQGSKTYCNLNHYGIPLVEVVGNIYESKVKNL